MMCVSSACCFHNSSDLEQQNAPFWDDVLHVCPDHGTEFDFLAVNAKRWVFSDPLCSKRSLCRVGEADNPGPLRVGSFNPHQLFNKEEVIAEWGDGIWGVLKLHTLLMLCGYLQLGFAKPDCFPDGALLLPNIPTMLASCGVVLPALA
jgi:hypothetical protein